jgi:hypothetical protein
MEESLQRNCIAAIISGPASPQRRKLLWSRFVLGIAALEIYPQRLTNKLGAGAGFFFSHLLELA